MNGRAETHSFVVYLSAKGLSRSFSFTSKVRINRPGDRKAFPSGIQIGEPGAKEIEGSAKR
jgi:hypothetical protein